jgi:hypothetical protein
MREDPMFDMLSSNDEQTDFALEGLEQHTTNLTIVCGIGKASL